MQKQTDQKVPQEGKFGAFVMTYNRAELLPRVRLDPEEGARIPTGILRGWLRLPLEPGSRAASYATINPDRRT